MQETITYGPEFQFRVVWTDLDEKEYSSKWMSREECEAFAEKWCEPLDFKIIDRNK